MNIFNYPVYKTFEVCVSEKKVLSTTPSKISTNFKFCNINKSPHRLLIDLLFGEGKFPRTGESKFLV